MSSSSPWTLRATGTPGGMVADPAEIRRAVALFADPEGHFQVVSLPTARTVVLPGRDVDGLALGTEGLPSGFGLYFQLNPVRADLTTKAKAADIIRRRWLLIDVDPLKAEGFEKESATDAEKESAAIATQAVFDHLFAAGWPPPVTIDSGNGWYLMHRIDLPNDEESRALVRSLLYHLDGVVKDLACSFDKSVHNADRLAKLPGTWARKGRGTIPGRPYRPCRIVCLPTSVDVVPVELIRSTVPEKEHRPAPTQPAWVNPFRRRATAGASPERYAAAALDGERTKLALTPVGGRDHQLYRSGAALGELVGANLLSESEVIETLTESARVNGLFEEIGEAEVLDKLRRSVAKGAQNPRVIPERNGKGHKDSGGKVQPEPTVDEPLTVNLATVEPATVEWLIRDRIPRGFIAVFAGRTSVGKSFVAYDLIARLSRGGEIPCAAGECFLPGGALIVGEDSHEYVIVPRLIEAGADLTRIHAMTWRAMNGFHLGDTELLDRAVKEIKGGVSMVLIDPPTNFLGDTDEHKNSEVRQLVMRVVEWALERNLACIFVLHVNKQAGKGVEALNRVMGSVAWVTTARIAHAFSPDPEDPTRCLWVPLKNNLGKLGKALAYRIVPTTNGQAVVEWVGEVDTTADEAMGHQPRQRRDVVAADWLVERFRERREWESDELFRAARQEHVSRDAIFEAKKALDLPRARRQTQENGDVIYVWWVPENWGPLSPSSPHHCDSCDSTTVVPESQDG